MVGVSRDAGLQDWQKCNFVVFFYLETCPKCAHGKAYFMQMQTRSADEPMTIFFKCCNPDCAHRWKE